MAITFGHFYANQLEEPKSWLRGIRVLEDTSILGHFVAAQPNFNDSLEEPKSWLRGIRVLEATTINSIYAQPPFLGDIDAPFVFLKGRQGEGAIDLSADALSYTWNQDAVLEYLPFSTNAYELVAGPFSLLFTLADADTLFADGFWEDVAKAASNWEQQTSASNLWVDYDKQNNPWENL